MVNPKHAPNDETKALASSATDIIDQAKIDHSISSVLSKATLILGTSARVRAQQIPRISAVEAAKLIVKSAKMREKVVVLFGPERTGLNNEVLGLCHYHIHIPANPDYSSINLAQAVQILAYEIYQASIVNDYPIDLNKSSFKLASFAEMERFFTHLEITLQDLEMLKEDNPKGIMHHLNLLFRRARPYSQELSLLRGFLKQAQLKSTGRVKVIKSSDKIT